MPSESQHRDKAFYNESFFEQIEHHQLSCEWQATVLFYAALHYTEMILAKENHHSSNHAVRLRAIAQHYKLQKVYKDYRWLYDQSREARYEVVQFNESFIQEDILPSFQTIKQLALSLDK